MNLKGQTVLIVGGTSGLGEATAAYLQAQGSSIAIVGRDEQKALDAGARLGPDVEVGVFDAADTTKFDEFAAQVGVIDHVVSFTGLQPAAPVAEADHDMFTSAFDARVWAARNCCAIVAPQMPVGGSFTFCSGVSSIRPRAGRSAGAVATAALESFSRAMAVELAPLRVNAVCPGAFDTEVLKRAMGANRDAIYERLANTIPLGRIGQPEEIAHAVHFLMTNTYTTGITLRVDGGALLN